MVRNFSSYAVYQPNHCNCLELSQKLFCKRMKLACSATRRTLFYSIWATSSDYIDCQEIALTTNHQDKKGFCYHGNQAKLQRLKSLVETNGKHGFDLKNFQFHYQLTIFFKETARGLPRPPLATASGTLACGSIPSFLLTTQVQ